MAKETQTGALINLERWDGKGDGIGKEMGWKFKREGMYVQLWLVHVEVRQKTTKFCKAIILQ